MFDEVGINHTFLKLIAEITISIHIMLKEELFYM